MTKPLRAVLAVLLWLTSIGLGIVEIGSVRNALLALSAWFIARDGVTPQQAQSTYAWVVVLSQFGVIFLAIGVAGVAIAGGEYHWKHFDERRSWRLFAWTLGIELVILLLTYPFA